MTRFLRLVQFVRSAVLAQPKTFLFVFGALAIYTWVLHSKYPLGPGQDYHFHLMVASINGRASSDPVRALYESIDPFTTNTLLYTLAYPFEKVLSPVRAFQVTVTLVYYLGFPIACAVALRRLGRPPWGSLLAFPLVYAKDWALNGFMPFLAAAPFYVLAIAEFHVAQSSSGKRARNAAIACGVFSVLTFLAHGHVFVWLALLLALLTIVTMVKKLGPIAIRPKEVTLDALRAGLRALAMILPALVLFGRWFFATHRGEHAATSNTQLRIADWPILDRLVALPGLLSPALSETDYVYIVVLALVVLACWLLSRRASGRRSSGLAFEICFLASIISYFVLPGSFGGGQSVAVRHLSLALWLLPLIVFETPRLRFTEWVAVTILAVFAFARVEFLGERLKKSNQEDYNGLLSLARECNKKLPAGRRGELAYAAIGRNSKSWRDAWSLQQAHETFAAVCNIDTPVYDTSVYPYNLSVPLRYRGRLPAPPTIVSMDPAWYKREILWKSFDYVLVQGWTVPQDEAERMLPHAELVARAGDFQLWRRK